MAKRTFKGALAQPIRTPRISIGDNPDQSIRKALAKIHVARLEKLAQLADEYGARNEIGGINFEVLAFLLALDFVPG